MLHKVVKDRSKYYTPRKCLRCEKTFQAYIYNIRRGWGKYCSRSCTKKNNQNRRGAKIDRKMRAKISRSLKKKYETGVLVSPLRTLGWIGRTGPGAANWRGGRVQESIRIRMRKDYQSWRKRVLDRDGRRCIMCKSIKNLQVDHIKSFSKFPELRTELNNGRTLCKECHIKTPNYGGRKKERV